MLWSTCDFWRILTYLWIDKPFIFCIWHKQVWPDSNISVVISSCMKYTLVLFVCKIYFHRPVKVLSHRERCVERCSNATDRKNRILYISHRERCVERCSNATDRKIRILYISRATQQCERIIVYSVLIFPLVALLHLSTHRSLCERTFTVAKQIYNMTRDKLSF